jgi:hypothetical protein
MSLQKCIRCLVGKIRNMILAYSHSFASHDRGQYVFLHSWYLGCCFDKNTHQNKNINKQYPMSQNTIYQCMPIYNNGPNVLFLRNAVPSNDSESWKI